MTEEQQLPLGIKLLSALYLVGGLIGVVAGTAMSVSSRGAPPLALGLIAALVLLSAGYLAVAGGLLVRKPWGADAAIGLSIITLLVDAAQYFNQPSTETVARIVLTLLIIFYLNENRDIYRD